MTLSEDTQLAVMNERQERMARDLKEVKDMIQQNYVTQEQFKPVRLFVYGLITLSLGTLAVAIFNLIPGLHK